MKDKVVVILGPTSSGKSKLAVKLAKEFNGQVVSADSRQVYKFLDIGTGKITKEEMQGIKHHLLSIASPKRKFTVWQYQQKAYKAIDSIIKRGQLPIIAGGSPFYIYAITEGMILPKVKPNLKLRKKLEKLSVQELFLMLKNKDPNRARTIEPKNKRRLIRALEIIEQKGKVPELKKRPRYQCLKIGIKVPPEILKIKIKKRLRERIKQGLFEEFKKLKSEGLSLKRMEELGLEYYWGAKFLEGKIKPKNLIEKLEKDILKFAKRQMTWFKKDKEIHWIKNFKQAKKLVSDFLNSK